MLAGAERRTASLRSELRLPAHGSELNAARAYARDAAARFGLDADRAYEFVYAVNEAVTNAVRHGAPDEQGRISLSILPEADRLTFVVRDWGTFAIPSLEPATTAEHGRGFALMADLVDDVQLSTEPGCTIVRLSKLRVASNGSDADALTVENAVVDRV
jgi:stage II sporulation protein AB (anti-sigma F factor)